jgi:hypothetical protein
MMSPPHPPATSAAHEQVLFLGPISFDSFSIQGQIAPPAPVLPISFTHHRVRELPKNAVRQRWYYDTAYGGQGFTSPEILNNDFGLHALPFGSPMPQDVDKLAVLALNGTVDLVNQAVGIVVDCPVYRANLWLLSDKAEFQERPILIELASNGIAAHPQRTHSLIGRKAFFGTGIEIRLDHRQPLPQLTVWVPRYLVE